MTVECQRCARERDDVRPRNGLGRWLCDECEPIARAQVEHAPAAEPPRATGGGSVPAPVPERVDDELAPQPAPEPMRRLRVVGDASSGHDSEDASPAAHGEAQATAGRSQGTAPSQGTAREQANRAGAASSPKPGGEPRHLRDVDPDEYLYEPTVRDQMDAVVAALELDGSVRAVASHMARSANGLKHKRPGRSMFESHGTLAARTGFSVATVKRARDALFKAGVIVVTGHKVLEGKKMPVYDVGWADVLAAERS
jgi:hypothetical protein